MEITFEIAFSIIIIWHVVWKSVYFDFASNFIRIYNKCCIKIIHIIGSKQQSKFLLTWVLYPRMIKKK